MKIRDNNIEAFLALVKSGLWEHDVRLLPFEKVDYEEIMRLAEEQSVVGLVTAGLELVSVVKVPQEWLLQFIGQTLQIEQRNKEMNAFIAGLVSKLRCNDIFLILVKGQGIAQCYERPLWRSSGDIDFLLSKDNYRKAVDFFKERYSNNKNGGDYSKETAFYTEQWMIEVHGSLRTCLSSNIDKEIDNAQKDVFYIGNVRTWDNGKTQVFLPGVNDDIFFVFTHFIKHFYKEGMNLRQICDWCRLLWKYREDVKPELLENRLRKSGLMAEWRAFAALAVDYLGMPANAMPLFDDRKKWHEKGTKVIRFIMKNGEWRKVRDTLTVCSIFPISVLRFLPGILFNVNLLKIKERLFRNGNR